MAHYSQHLTVQTCGTSSSSLTVYSVTLARHLTRSLLMVCMVKKFLNWQNLSNKLLQQNKPSRTSSRTTMLWHKPTILPELSLIQPTTLIGNILFVMNLVCLMKKLYSVLAKTCPIFNCPVSLLLLVIIKPTHISGRCNRLNKMPGLLRHSPEHKQATLPVQKSRPATRLSEPLRLTKKKSKTLTSMQVNMTP